MSRVVFLLEEPSMKVFLKALLPRAFPGLEFLCVPHEGKQDLEKSIPRKLRAWNEAGVRFVVIRDNDRDECKKVKSRLRNVCEQAGRPETVIRIACQELEGESSSRSYQVFLSAMRNLTVTMGKQREE